jgi:hypothetical protein
VSAAVAVAALVTTAAVAHAEGTPAGTGGILRAGTTSWSMSPATMGNGDWSYGSWQGHQIVLPARLAPTPGSRLSSILVGRGVLAYTCVRGTFILAGPQINLFTPAGGPSGLHFTVPNPVAPLVWASSVDGSRADMQIVREIPTRNTVTRVLLRAVTRAGGPGTTFGLTTAIVRLPITGGVPPRRCFVPGQRLGVPFLTLYLVFRGGTFHVTLPTPVTKSNAHY